MADPGTPTLINPISGIQIEDNTPTLSFVIPSDADNDQLVFMAELDTTNPIDTGSDDYLKMESRLEQGIWQYDNGSSFVDMPTAGVGSTYYGNTATVTVEAADRLANDIWYWRISVSDQLTTVKYGNTATYACNRYG